MLFNLVNNLGTFQCEVCPRMLYPCCKPAVTHHDNKIYVFGGFCKDGTPIHFVQQFDIGEKNTKTKDLEKQVNMQ